MKMITRTIDDSGRVERRVRLGLRRATSGPARGKNTATRTGFSVVCQMSTASLHRVEGI